MTARIALRTNYVVIELQLPWKSRRCWGFDSLTFKDCIVCFLLESLLESSWEGPASSSLLKYIQLKHSSSLRIKCEFSLQTKYEIFRFIYGFLGCFYTFHAVAQTCRVGSQDLIVFIAICRWTYFASIDRTLLDILICACTAAVKMDLKTKENQAKWDLFCHSFNN